jgi:hypothetical protein
MDESSPFIQISPAGIAYLAEPPPPGYVTYSSRTPSPGSPDVSGVVSSNTDQASIPDDGPQGHAVLAASQREELLLVFSSQGGTLLGSANLGIALMKLRLITGTRLPMMMATPLILPLPLLIERINSWFIFNFYFFYFYFPFVLMFVHRTTYDNDNSHTRCVNGLLFLFSFRSGVVCPLFVLFHTTTSVLSSFCLYIR